MEYQQASPATNFSKKLANGGGLTGKHVYDGVFGAPANPGARMEDYREIFGGSAACSIPVLDFPELKERNFSIEVRGLRPDYSAIFGGGGEADFGVPYEELFPKAKRGKSRSQEERVQTEASSRSVKPKPSNSKEEQRAQSSEVSSTTVDDVKQFNLSYNRSNPGIKNGTIGTTHIAQLHAVPGYTHLIDEQATQKESNSGKVEQKTLNDASLNANANEGIKERKPSSKSVSGPQPQESSEERKPSSKPVSGPQPQESSEERKPSSKSVSGPQPQESSEAPKKTRRHWSFANDVSFDFEIGLSTQPSTSPSNVGSDVGSMKAKSGAFGGDGKESSDGSYSPPMLDEELDVNSAAAAVRKAIEEAQAKLRIAKELMERKKQGLPDHVKPSFTNGAKGKRREKKVAEKMNGSSITKEPSVVKFVVKESKAAQLDSRLENESRNSIGRFSVPTVIGESKETAVGVNQEVNFEAVKPSDNMKLLDGEKKLEACEENLKQENFQREMNPVEVTFRWDIFRHNIKSDEELHQVGENEEVARVVNESSEAACGPDITHLPEENEEVARVVNESSEAACGPDMTDLPEESEEVARVVNESSEAACGTDVTNLPEENAEPAIREVEIEDAVDQVGDEMRQREAESQEEMKIRSNEGLTEENENEYGTGQKEEVGSTECERKQEESFHQEENDMSRISNPKPEGGRKWFDVNREEVIGAIRSSLRDEEDSENKQGEYYDTGSDGDLVYSTESDGIFQEDYQMNEIGKRNSNEAEDLEMKQPEDHQWAEDKNDVEVVENLEATDYAYKQDDSENPGESGEADGLEGKVEVAEVTVEDAVLEQERVAESSDPIENGRESDVFNEANDWVETENVQTDDMVQGPSVSDRSKNQATDMSSSEPESMFDHKQFQYQMTEFEHFEEASFSSGDNERDASDQGTDVSGQGSESNTVSSGDDKWFSHGIDSMMSFTSEKQVDEGAKEPQIPADHEEFESYLKSSVEKVEEKMRESQEGRIHQNIDQDKNHQETQTAENRDSEVNLKKKLEHREKMERLAVERAIREVRERAFAEARERAEQAAAKKAAAGTREKSEKVSSETSAKSAADKASMEAKLKAQRAAVERATAEARERALRKALSEKSSSKTGKQVEKSTSEKFSGASRGSETKPNDQQSKGPGELAEKCKATYERNQRTAERAAKALAEKNMRDLQAQKELAERNRLAEILDAEVKRWATGKERNLRALLSTLQYILGSDSGWQPIPLTDLIASAAVKKAYRKATLFVHPDKLQQRGASIQQKYTCEKVFDLLKDAWNKFSAEER